MNKKEYEDQMNAQYKQIVTAIAKDMITPQGVPYKLDVTRKRDAVVAAYWFGVAMAKAIGAQAKMGDTEVKLPGETDVSV